MHSNVQNTHPTSTHLHAQLGTHTHSYTMPEHQWSMHCSADFWVVKDTKHPVEVVQGLVCVQEPRLSQLVDVVHLANRNPYISQYILPIHQSINCNQYTNISIQLHQDIHPSTKSINPSKQLCNAVNTMDKWSQTISSKQAVLIKSVHSQWLNQENLNQLIHSSTYWSDAKLLTDWLLHLWWCFLLW